MQMSARTCRLVSLIYGSIAFSYLLLVSSLSSPWLSLYKAMPIILLAVLSMLILRGTVRLLLSAALTTSACGDIILASNIEQGFIYGLAAFAMAHLCYSGCFLRWFKLSVRPVKFFVVLLLILLTVVSLVLPKTATMFIPALVYIGIIFIMATLAIFASQQHYYFIAGALLFVMSDSLIALNKFVAPVPAEHLLVMTSYYLAQYCLFMACIKQVNHDVSIA